MGKLHGRFGLSSRYGKRIREQVINTEQQYREPKSCPSCSRVTIKRVASGIWVCKHCDAKFASSAYEFKL